MAHVTVREADRIVRRAYTRHVAREAAVDLIIAVIGIMAVAVFLAAAVTVGYAVQQAVR